MVEEKPSEEGREKREVKLCLCANWCVGVLPVGSDTGYGSVICKRLLFCWKQKYVVTSDRSSHEKLFRRGHKAVNLDVGRVSSFGIGGIR